MVDDEEIVLKSLEKLLNKEGYDVVTTQSGKEALEIIKKTDFDIIITDIKMAEMDGVETAIAIRKYFKERNKPEVPVVFITGYSDLAEQKHVQKLGEVFIKPFDNEELIEDVKIKTEIVPYKEIYKGLQIERRFSPRVKTEGLFIKLLPDVEANIINISETGIRVEYKGSVLPEDILLLMNLPTFPLKQSIKIPAKIVWCERLSEDKFQFGANFLLDKDRLSQIRDFIFDNFTKKATSEIVENDLKIKVENFFKKTVRQYYENLLVLAQETNTRKLDPGYIEQRLTKFNNDFLLECEDIEKKIDNNFYIKKVKQVFREIMGCCYYKSPITKIAYDRPRGYPGDFELFEMIYNNKPIAEKNSIGFYCDKLFLNSPYAIAARSRKNKMKNILQDFIENSNLPTIRLLNIACGSSREIRELFSDPLFLSVISNKEIIFTGLDNDKDALEFSKSALSNLPLNVKTRFLHENVLNVFRDEKYFDIIGKQDIIYILGLTEYLPDRIFKRLLNFLFQLLNKKGMLVVTYKDKDITFPSVGPDWVSDWAFIKRGKDDLIKAAKEIGADEHSLKIEKEGTETIFFLKIIKS
ncbi:MAG: response regulator [Candidatus Omnitrophica bacterium]|nr:response regulator [Candidatus Omnitrophota bacterium]